MSLASLLAGLLISGFPSAWAADLPSAEKPKTLVGVLEEPQCKKEHNLFVRALFAKRGQEWIPLSSGAAAHGYLAPRISWEVALDGRRVGELETVDPGPFPEDSWYSRDRLLSIAPNQVLPHISNQAQQFLGWCESPKDRPLVVVSHGGTSDPDGWKPFTPTKEQIAQLFKQFEKRAGKASICTGNSKKRVPFHYRPDDVEAMKSYKDGAGRQIISLHLKPRKDGAWDGFLPNEWDSHTFLVSDRTIYLGAGLTLVDAGAYDAGSGSEVLFWFTAYNTDGYVLYSPAFDKRVDYLWNYH